jgi:hypothetical protein
LKNDVITALFPPSIMQKAFVVLPSSSCHSYLPICHVRLCFHTSLNSVFLSPLLDLTSQHKTEYTCSASSIRNSSEDDSIHASMAFSHRQRAHTFSPGGEGIQRTFSEEEKSSSNSSLRLSIMIYYVMDNLYIPFSPHSIKSSPHPPAPGQAKKLVFIEIYFRDNIFISSPRRALFAHCR